MYPYGTGKMSESHPLARKTFFEYDHDNQRANDPFEPLGRAGLKSQFVREQCCNHDTLKSL